MNILRQISLGSLGLVVGTILSLMGFVAYAKGNSTLNLVGFFYGIPVLLGGLALKAAELKPIPSSQPTPELLILRDQQSTAIQNQIRKDVTRYRYGQKAHLDTSLKYLGLSPTDEERPILSGLKEAEIEGAYALLLEFYTPLIPLSVWQQKQNKIEKFFGPGIQVKLRELPENQIELALITQPEFEETSTT
jgi:hypothetical protein